MTTRRVPKAVKAEFKTRLNEYVKAWAEALEKCWRHFTTMASKPKAMKGGR